MYTLEQIYEALGKIENGGTMVADLQDAIRDARDEAAKNRIEKNKILDQLNLRQSGDTDGALKNLVATLTALQNAGDALSTLDTQMNGLKFQSTLLMRGATYVVAYNHSVCPISIHAPHARSDDGRCGNKEAGLLISIHAPHARSDAFYLLHYNSQQISIHAPHARSDLYNDYARDYPNLISIHAPHARGDTSAWTS